MKKQTTAVFLMVALGLFQPGLADLRAQGPQEGIKVHGHWTIDVRQPDGTLVTHREFENALTTGAVSGSDLLAKILARQFTPGEWQVVLDNSSSSLAPCLTSSSQPIGCNVSEATQIASSSYVFKTLSVTYASEQVKLDGTATAARNGSIARVSTWLGGCASTVPPGQCQGASLGQAATITTAAALSDPVPVLAGQIIQVTVVIRFS